MADIIDVASDLIENQTASTRHAISQKAKSIAKGAPGYCEECGEFSKRLVKGHCAPCRDELELE